jgi:anaphase-promoting complex subunit 2
MLLESLARLRGGEMWEVVVEYPDSAPAVEDLGAALRHTNMAGAFCR